MSNICFAWQDVGKLCSIRYLLNLFINYSGNYSGKIYLLIIVEIFIYSGRRLYQYNEDVYK